MKTNEAARSLGRALGRLKRFRDKWMLVAFLASATLWIDGTLRAYLTLPETLEQHAAEISALKGRLTAVEHLLARDRCRWSVCLRRKVTLAL
ncbi:hypothetical protein KHP62_18185 [Rhodobacteraceae bacterium NNCM2]|nr:hypothetical protein [Coraliihabitans acroporae]